MHITIDILLLILAGLIIFICWRRGLVKSVLGLVCDIAAIFLAYALTPLLSDFLCSHIFLDSLSSGIDSTVRSAATTSAGVDVSTFLSKIPETLAGTLDKYRVEDNALKAFVSDLKDTGENAVEKVSDFIAKPTSQIISNVLAFILIFVVSLIALRLLSKLIVVLFKAPVIRTADHLAGLALGVVNALLILWVVSLAINSALGAFGSYMPQWFGETAEKSVILKFFAKYNPISVLGNVLDRIG